MDFIDAHVLFYHRFKENFSYKKLSPIEQDVLNIWVNQFSTKINYCYVPVPKLSPTEKYLTALISSPESEELSYAEKKYIELFLGDSEGLQNIEKIINERVMNLPFFKTKKELYDQKP